MKTNNLILKAALSVGGSIALFFGGLMLPMSIFGDMVEGASRWPGIITGSVFTIVSIFCFVKLFILNRRNKRFNRYTALIGNQKSIPIKWLSDKMNCTTEKTILNIREAMSYGLFADAYIDEKNELLLFPNYNAYGALKTVYCTNCGAGSEVMTGYYSKCKYCGFVLDTGRPM